MTVAIAIVLPDGYDNKGEQGEDDQGGEGRKEKCLQICQLARFMSRCVRRAARTLIADNVVPMVKKGLLTDRLTRQ